MSVAMLKNALITTATVLAVVYVLNKTPAKGFVQTALNG